MWFIETKDTPRGKWRKLMFVRLYETREAAIAAATELEEMGGCVVRVRSEVASENRSKQP